MEVMRIAVIVRECGIVLSAGFINKKNHFIARMDLVVLKKKTFVTVKNNVRMAVMHFAAKKTVLKCIVKNLELISVIFILVQQILLDLVNMVFNIVMAFVSGKLIFVTIHTCGDRYYNCSGKCIRDDLH